MQAQMKDNLIVDAAIEMMLGNVDAAMQWLHAPLGILDGHSPLDYAVTEHGAREVEKLITQIQYGVFS